jgi:hypothetical protein
LLLVRAHIHRFVALIPSTTHWEFPLYELEHLPPDDIIRDVGKSANSEPSTTSLWEAIFTTKAIGWVKRSGATLGTPTWEKWLKEAYEQALAGNRLWDAQGHLHAIMSGITSGEDSDDHRV